MKKAKIIIAVILTVIALISASAIYVVAATDEAVEGYYTFKKFNSKITISDVDTAISGDVVVPDTLDGCDVIAIADYAFENCDKVTSITVPEIITTIGQGAFKGMTALESVTVPFVGQKASATGDNSVFGYVFDYTTEVVEGTVDQGNGKYYYIPSTIKNVTVTSDTSIPNNAFCNVSSIENITLNAAKSIGDYAFYNCTALKSLPMSETLETIGHYAYLNTVQVTELVVPDSVTSIGIGAFKGQNKVTSVTVPFTGASANASDYKGVFGYIFGCTQETTDFGLTDGGNKYYYNLPTSIKNVTITKDTTIPAYAFYNCVNYSSITMNSVKSIGAYAFVGCEKLTDIGLGNQLESIGDYAFSGLSHLTELPLSSTLKTIGSYAFKGLSAVKEVVIPDGVTSIAAGTFQGMNSLEKITLPFVGRSRGSVSDSGNYTDRPIGVFGWIFGTATQSDATTYQNHYSSSNGFYYAIPKSLRTVTITQETLLDDYAFQNCSFLTEINIPDTVNSNLLLCIPELFGNNRN